MTLGAFKKETAETILAVVRYLKESGFVIDQPGRGQQFIPPQAPIYVRNDSGEEIPPFACMQTNGAVDAGGQNYLKVVKPVDDTGAAGRYLFNSIAPIEIGGYGIGHDGPLVRMLTDGSTVTCGDLWQPDIGEWAVTTGGELFTAAGADDIDTNVMRAFIGGSGGGSERIKFRITAAVAGDSTDPCIDGTDDDFTGTTKLTVTVIGRICTGNTVSLGDTAYVYDDDGCLIGTEELSALIDRIGWATAFVTGESEGAALCCHWSLDGLCCP